MTNAPVPYQNLDIPNYQQHRDNQLDHLLLDVRESWEYTMYRIPGAVNIPLNEVPARLNEIPDDKPVVVVCEHGVRSVYVAQYLSQQGYGGVYNLVGGTSEWVGRGLPIER
jgi:rhodanese-related sulfurtransferase